ncbi:UPF0182 family membrane protein [Virgibacillus sp. W0181]|uniref:UPF0182 family membrane protein n=1 Tax=Virgibacillus sp. W0181 TaxID=3391581 RepID=UPI003F45B9AB
MSSRNNRFEKWGKIGKRMRFIIALLLVLIVVGFIVFQWLTDYIWMDTLGYESIFMTIFTSKVALGVSGFVLFFICTYFTLFWIRHTYVSHFGREQLPPIMLHRKQMSLIMLGCSAVVGVIGSTILQGVGWEPALKLLNHTAFGVKDPYFNMDVSFYIFILPFLEFIVYVLFGLTLLFLIAQIAAYSVFHIYRMSRSAQIHLSVTIGVLGLLLAGLHALEPYGTLLTNQVNIFQKSTVYGLSYTDELINIPKSYVLAAVAVIAAIWIIVALGRKKLQSIMMPVIVYAFVLVAGQAASVVVQNFIVSPNEFSKESPYLQHNLDFTRAAYDLDKIKVEEHPGDYSLTKEMVERNELTINNVRLNDSRPLLDIYNQLQTFRTYYKFNDMDIDRYEIDGNYEQVFIGARELSTADLPSQAQTWVNKNLRYTHGYGIAMSHVNEVTSQGQPKYLMKNLPAQGEFDISREQIYFGEEPYPNVIVNSKVDEFDYPTGDQNESNRFEERTGIPLNGFNRFLFALSEGSFRMLVSDQITSESQLLDTRNIMDRVKRIAPFFRYDSDPYIFIREDGTLAWMLDAYLSAENYPYSEAHKGNENYIRNSVKVVMDAYSGEVDFYVADPEDPLLQTYKNMFPELFKEDMPEDVRAHIRYPEMLFKIQSAMYGTYHMSNLEVFYNREDFWQFPTEKYFNKDIEMEPYYITMRMPEAEEEEFILMMPYTPKNRQNMIAWIGVRNDGEHYGDMFIYQFPKQKNIYGPQQIENRINQDSYISQQLNLWSQGGSEVIRGNLLAIPIEDTVLYVEPIYIESSNETSLPEVKQVVMAYEDEIVMEETFEKSLEKILGLIDPEAAEPEDEEGEAGAGEESDEQQIDQEPIAGAEAILKEFSDLFNAYQSALSAGDWEKAGEIMKEIESKLTTVE